MGTMAEQLKEFQDTQAKNEEEAMDAGELGTPLEEEAVTEVEEEEEKEVEEEDTSEKETPPVEEKKLKYKDQEAAEEAYTAAEKRMHKATTETANERRRAEAAERELAAYKQPPEKTVDPVEAITEKYYSQVATLPDTEDRDKKVFSIMAKMNREIARIETDSKFHETARSEKGYADTEKMAIGFGLKEENLSDFWTYASNPEGATFEEQVKWAVGKASRISTKTEDEIKAEVLAQIKADEAEKKKLNPLGKGSNKLRSKADEKELSMSDQLLQSRQERVYGK